MKKGDDKASNQATRLQRAVGGCKTVTAFDEKHFVACGRKQLSVSRTAHALRGPVRVNLGGTAEVLSFVPYGMKDFFVFLPHLK